MKTAQMVAVALVGVASIPLMGRQPPNGVQEAGGAPSLSGGSQAPQANAAGTGTASSQQSASAAAAHAYSLVVSEMRAVSGELDGKLNSQSAKAGDQVMVKTTHTMMTADGTEVPKGSRVVGHVIAAQAYAKGGASAQLKIVFDRAELHGGGSVAIHCMIQTVAPARRETSDLGYGGGAGAGMGSGPAMGGGPGMGGDVGAMGGGMGQGGMGQGGMGAGAPGAGQMGTGVDRTAGGAGDASNPMIADIPASLPGPMYGVAQLSDSLAPRYTGFPGLMVQADASGATSGTLFAVNRSIRLDEGTRVVLGIVALGN